MILMEAGGKVVDADSGTSGKPVCVSSCGTAGKVSCVATNAGQMLQVCTKSLLGSFCRPVVPARASLRSLKRCWGETTDALCPLCTQGRFGGRGGMQLPSPRTPVKAGRTFILFPTFVIQAGGGGPGMAHRRGPLWQGGSTMGQTGHGERETVVMTLQTAVV